jgi:hypothetical protein
MPGGGIRTALALMACVALAPAGARGADETFLDIAVEPASGAYLVLKAVNLRAKPSKRSKKVGKLKKGMRVTAAGRPKERDWLAITAPKGKRGFVYLPMVIALVDGALEKDLEGKTAVKDGPSCTYVIAYDGKSEVSDALFDVADYDVEFRCEGSGKTFEFGAFMFITEAPYQLSQNLVHQISIDVREIGDGFDEVFSTTMFYQRKKSRVVFDSVSLRDFAKTPAVKERPAKDVPGALSGAIEIALGAWNKKVWETLSALKSETN